MIIATPVKPAASKKKVLVVDDHAIVRTGLVTLINEEQDLIICGEAENERSGLEAAHQLRPDVVVVDWSLKNTEAAEMVATLRQNYPRLPVLVLSIHDELYYADRALRAGANGYVMKREAADRIVAAIRCVADGRRYLSERAEKAVGKPPPATKNQGRVLEHPATASTALVKDESGAWVARQASTWHAPTKVSIVIPVYNSEHTIGQLCELLIKELATTYRLQIVLVDDGSQDNSQAVCQGLHERHPDVVDAISLSKNFGEHNAVMAGLNCADGDYCVIMDDDFQNPPSEVRKLVAEIDRGYDVVYTRYERMKQSWFRNLGSRVHNWMATRALGKPPELYLSSFKVLSRFMVREAVTYTGPDPYLDAIILRATRRLGCVTVRHDPRKEGRSGYTLAKLIALWSNMFIAFSLYPLRLLCLVGITMTVVGTFQVGGLLLSMVVPALEEPDDIDRLNASMWFFRGLILLAVGIVGEYVGRIYRHLTRDPQFIIRTFQRHGHKN